MQACNTVQATQTEGFIKMPG